MDTQRALDQLRPLIDAALKRNPDESLRVFLDRLDFRLELSTQRAVCRHCGNPIAKLGNGEWLHTDSLHTRKCRWASFDTDDETKWLPDLDGDLRAKPQPN